MAVAIIEQRRNQARKKIASLRGQRGELVLDKADTAGIDAQIRALESELAKYEDAGEAAERREHERRCASSLESKRRFLERVGAAEERRLAAVAEVEKNARGLAAALTAMYSATDEASELVESLRHYAPMPGVLGERQSSRQHVDWRLSERLSAVLWPAVGPSGVMGQIRFPHPKVSAAEDWATEERRVSEGELAALLRAAKRTESEAA